jgi:hypothetical protein
MHTLPRAIIPILCQFELLFSERVWEWAKILLSGNNCMFLSVRRLADRL